MYLLPYIHVVNMLENITRLFGIKVCVNAPSTTYPALNEHHIDTGEESAEFLVAWALQKVRDAFI